MIRSTYLNARLLFTVASLTFAGLSTGCFYGDTGYETFKGPPGGDEFEPVSGVLERRCGTLDCHGSLYRPLRIFGKGGLRLDAMNVSGGAATTDAEHDANYLAAISLEPEILQRVLKKEAFPKDLTLIRKPLLLEKHKGGPVLSTNSPGYLCLANWLFPDDNFKPGTCDKEQ